MLDLLPQGMRKSLQAAQETWEQSSAQGKLEIAFFRPAEIINATWLLYVTLAQTFGAYVNCTCMSSTWAGYGGYIDFTQYSTTNSPWVKFYWTAGTAVSTAILTVAMVYIVAEWCLQSHISTSNYDSAMRGLRRTRQFRRATYPFRLATDIVIELAYLLRNLVYQALRRQKPLRPGRRSLKWTRSDGVPVNVVPSIELPDLGPRQRSGSQAADPLLGSDIADELPTPDLAHSRGRRHAYPPTPCTGGSLGRRHHRLRSQRIFCNPDCNRDWGHG
ncbi:hypothetical protein H2203_006014 [Taxawa tesnikishii (nom. ined.)]|nr:hypothetical protein H2203_006014 [Dothideales sp. JES 119]